VIMQRDRRVLRFIEDFGCCDTGRLHKLFFTDVTMRRCQQRLAQLAKNKRIERRRDFIGQNYLYYMTKPKQIDHMLKRVDVYLALTQMVTLNEFIPEFTLGDLRADAYFEVWKNNRIYPYFLEVQRNTQFDQSKYECYFHSAEWQEKWNRFPTVIILSGYNIKLKPSEIKYTIIESIANFHLTN
jgi:hypothetical protein